MSRTPNDDRSDTMNPNNEAFWADQENRFGGLDDEDDYVADDHRARRPKRDRDPHAELRRKLELAYATPESEERDNREARVGFLCRAEEVMTIAADVATKQHFGGRVIKGDGFVELVLGDGRCVRAVDVAERSLIQIGDRHFGYAAKEWYEALGKKLSDDLPVVYVRADTANADPHEALLRALVTGGGPTLAGLRQQIESLTRGPEHSMPRYPFEPLVVDPAEVKREAAARREAVREIQEKIAEIKAKLPAGFESESWEDTWAPSEPRRV